MRTALASLFFLLVLVSAGAVFLFPGLYPVRQIWKGHFTLVYGSDFDPVSINESLREAGFPGLISAETSPIEFTVFDGEEATAVSNLDQRFDSSDPRYDPYMKKLAAAFTADSPEGMKKVAFLPISSASFYSKLRVQRLLRKSGGDIFLADKKVLPSIITLASFFAIAALLALRYKKSWYVVLLGSLVWVQLVGSGDIPLFVCSSLLYFLWVVVVDDFVLFHMQRLFYKNSRAEGAQLRRKGIYYLFAIIAVLTLLGLGERGIEGAYSILPSLAGQGFLLISYGYFLILRKARSEHRLFIPLPIMRRTAWGDWHNKYRTFTPGVLLLVFVPIVFSPIMDNREGGIVLPVPESAPGAEFFDWEALEILSLDKGPEHLPDFSDYIAHRAFQQGFLYGRSYSRPIRNEQVFLSVFAENEWGIEKTVEIVKEFNDGWLEGELAVPPHLSYASLLLEQGQPVRVFKREIPAAVPQLKDLILYILLAIVVFAPFMIPRLKLRGGALHDINIPDPRRRQQAA